LLVQGGLLGPVVAILVGVALQLLLWLGVSPSGSELQQGWELPLLVDWRVDWVGLPGQAATCGRRRIL